MTRGNQVIDNYFCKIVIYLMVHVIYLRDFLSKQDYKITDFFSKQLVKNVLMDSSLNLEVGMNPQFNNVKQPFM